jgi:Tol biopolymer transport system component
MTTFVSDLAAYHFAWAPNGNDYAFTRYVENHGHNIFLNQNGEIRQITSYPGNDADPVFSPDGRSLAFSSQRRGETQVWRIGL